MKKIKKIISDFILNKIAPDYRSIKLENKELHLDIYNIVEKTNEIEGVSTRMRWKIKFQMDDAVMQGDGDCFVGGFKGLLNNDKLN